METKERQTKLEERAFIKGKDKSQKSVWTDMKKMRM